MTAIGDHSDAIYIFAPGTTSFTCFLSSIHVYAFIHQCLLDASTPMVTVLL
jgi:hypothetical protein